MEILSNSNIPLSGRKGSQSFFFKWKPILFQFLSNLWRKWGENASTQQCTGDDKPVQH